MYKVVFTQRALKDLENIDRGVQNRIATKLKEYAKDPIKYSRKLTHSKIGGYRFRIGDYRVVFDIGGNDVVILRIRHRKSVYK